MVLTGGSGRRPTKPLFSEKIEPPSAPRNKCWEIRRMSVRMSSLSARFSTNSCLAAPLSRGGFGTERRDSRRGYGRRQDIQDAVAELKRAAKALTKPAFAADPDEPKSSHTGYQSLTQRSGTRAWIVIAAALLLRGSRSRGDVIARPQFRSGLPLSGRSGRREISGSAGDLARRPQPMTRSAAGPDGKRMAWLQALDSARARHIPNTEAPRLPSGRRTAPISESSPAALSRRCVYKTASLQGPRRESVRPIASRAAEHGTNRERSCLRPALPVVCQRWRPAAELRRRSPR